MTNESDNWEDHWEKYSAAATWNPAQIMRHDLILQIMPLYRQNKFNILDLGCGQGDFLAKAKTIFPEACLAGLEISEQGVVITRQKVPDAKVIVGDLLNPPIQLNEYQSWADLAICSEVLEHLDEPVRFLQAARHYLSNQGRLILTVPGGPISAFDRHIGHRQHFNRRSISDLMRQSGFVVEKSYSAGFPFFNLYRLAIILRGNQVAKDAKRSTLKTLTVAKIIAKIFEKLFFFNLQRSPFGWQMVAVGRPT